MTDESFAAWLKDNPVPDLQELVRRFGRYDLITAEAWAEFDRAMADWQQRRRAERGATKRSSVKRGEPCGMAPFHVQGRDLTLSPPIRIFV
jgi:hypothetical protein